MSNENQKINSVELPVNPLDELFGTAPISDLSKEVNENYVQVTESEISVIQGEELIDPLAKDDEDKEIDSKIDDVYKAAIDAFNTQTGYMELIEPRYAARNAEVAAQYLNTALQAANSRARVKADRVKTKAFVPYNNAQSKLGGQTVTASREEIMRMLGE